MIELCNILRTRRELVQNLVARELKSRYKGSVLGFLWSILTPLFMAFIYVFFLRLLAGRGVPTEEIIIGVFAWQFTAMCVTGGMTAITGNANLVKKVYFPRVVMPLSVTLANLVNFILSLVVQFVIVAILLHLRGAQLSLWVLALPAIVLLHTLFNLALAMFMASANVYFRDTQHLVGVLLSAWFFVSPVMYNLSFVEKAAAQWPTLSGLYVLNPMAVIITAYRATALPDVAFPWTAVSVAGLVLPLLLIVVAQKTFERSQHNFSDML
ncbi:MAG: Teichoic acid translocation permease protein TagG [Verrucomicrobia bacterium ADurb.Bin345]|nr:MAG: Teichoic acid translocation permease protein TagG [Verrucomicrobia bacterium ADurb.Bin345]